MPTHTHEARTHEHDHYHVTHHHRGGPMGEWEHRTHWHSHDNGQLLMVEQGRMRVQRRGEAMKEVGVGASDYTGPNVVHWHGATPDGPLLQINVGFGGGSKWFDAVTDAAYAGK